MKYDVVIIGGGPAGVTAGVKLMQAGKRCLVVSEGLSRWETEKSSFVSLRGVFLPGDSVISGEWEGSRLVCVHTRKLEREPLEADAFILATGRFFSRGLRSTMDKVYEPIFDCDVQFDPDRSKWVDPDFFAPQPFERFGVVTDRRGRVLLAGKPADNLYAVGGILAGEQDMDKSIDRVCRSLK